MYTIIISEQQRLILQQALEALVCPNGNCPDDVESEEAILFDLIRDLPEMEAADPTIIHSLCC